MRIVFFGMPYYNYTKSQCYALDELGHTVLMVENTENNSEAIKSQKRRMIDFKPEVFINFCGNYKSNIIDAKFLLELGSCKKITMFADAIKFVGDIEQNIQLYDKVYVFEPSDLDLLKQKYGIDGRVLYASVAEEIFCKKYEMVEVSYDLSFVGVMTKERLDFFERIAKHAYHRNLKMVVFGHFWHDKHWWQNIISKYKFKRKYPNLMNFAKNTYMQPEDVALLYKQTKICLNKHIDRHQGMGSRTFEIMANNNFCLCDERVQAKEYGLIDGENIVFYKDVEDCVKKIEYYLVNDKERKVIAETGGIFVRNKYTTKAVMRNLLDEVCE